MKKQKRKFSWSGLILIILSIVIYLIRPGQHCGILNPLSCIGLAFAPLFILASAILLIIGVIEIIRGKKE